MLIDAGLSFREICRRLQAVGQDPQGIDAVLISHEHSDHITGLRQLVKKTKAPIYLTGMTRDAIDWKDLDPTIETFQAGQRIAVGDLEVDTFTIPHDAIDPVMFCVRWQGIKAGYVTDLGYMPDSIKHQIQGCDMLVLESNHDLEMLKVGPYPWFVKNDFDAKPRVLVLAHLSENNNHPEIARLGALESLKRANATETRLVVASQKQVSEVFEF